MTRTRDPKLTVFEQLSRAQHEGYGVEPEYAQGFNNGLERATEIFRSAGGLDKGMDHYRMLIALIDEAESELAVRGNEYVAALRAWKKASPDLAAPLREFETARARLELAAIRRVEVFDKVYDELGMERT